MTTAFDLSSTYLWLDDNGNAQQVENTPDFWPNLVAGKLPTERRLMTAFHFEHDFPHWEMHPNGDEIIHIASGCITLLFDVAQQNGPTELKLDTAKTVVIPKGVWHRSIVHQPGFMIALTAGEGTQTRPI